MSASSTGYCIWCGKKMEYFTKLPCVGLEIRGVCFSYVENTPCCISCGAEVYVPEIEDRNSAARKFAFNQALEKLRHKLDSGGGKT